MTDEEKIRAAWATVKRWDVRGDYLMVSVPIPPPVVSYRGLNPDENMRRSVQFRRDVECINGASWQRFTGSLNATKVVVEERTCR